jgi:hypothetical protein
MATIGDRGKQYFADPGDGRRKGTPKLASLRDPLLDSFRQEYLHRQAHPTSYYTELGVVSLVGFVLNSGDSEWLVVRDREGYRGNGGAEMNKDNTEVL